jgi:hypothetical protein
MTRSIVRPHVALAALAALVALGACERYDEPNAPLPDIQAIGLDGSAWNRQALKGKPWVINLWVPR